MGGGWYRFPLLDQVVQARSRQVAILPALIYADEFPVEIESGDSRAAGTRERIENDVVLVRAGDQAALDQLDRFLRGMLSKTFFFALQAGNFPDSPHLLAAVHVFHLAVVKLVSHLVAFLRLASPPDQFRGMRESPAAQVRRRVGFFPDDVVQEPKAVHLQRQADAGVHMQGARYPNRACWLQDSETLLCPGAIEFVVPLDATAAVPVSLVYLHHLSGNAGDPVVRKIVGRVGPNAVDGIVRHLAKNFQGVPLANHVTVTSPPGVPSTWQDIGKLACWSFWVSGHCSVSSCSGGAGVAAPAIVIRSYHRSRKRSSDLRGRCALAA